MKLDDSSAATKEAIELADIEMVKVDLPAYSALLEVVKKIADGATDAQSLAAAALLPTVRAPFDPQELQARARGMKLFRGNWDGKRERAVVCLTKKRAMELLGATARTMSDFFSSPTTVIREDDKVLWENLETVFQRAMTYGPTRDAWERVEPN